MSQTQIDELLRQIEELQKKIWEDPQAGYAAQARKLAKAVYQEAARLFEEKQRRGIALLPEEQDILELCRREASRPEALQGILSQAFHSMGQIRMIADNVKDWFGASTEKDLAGRYLAQYGDELLPNYRKLLTKLFVGIDELLTPSFLPTIVSMAQGQALAARHYQVKNQSIDKAAARRMLDFADFAYQGYDAGRADGYVSLLATEVPYELRVLYDQRTGLLDDGRGLRVWLGKKDTAMVIAFSGTSLKSASMLYADVAQMSSPSLLYLKAAGLVHKFTSVYNNRTFYVTGHSLGGGLSQFALTAACSTAAGSLYGFAFNPAGLSDVSLSHLGEWRLSQSKNRMQVFMTPRDPVSTFGGKIGSLVTLPKTAHNGHGMKDLKECMKAYLEQRVVCNAASPVSVNGCVYTAKEAAPYLPYLSFKEESGTNYWPCFYSDCQGQSPASRFGSFQIPKLLWNRLAPMNQSAPPLAGIYEKFNGTGHTVANRLLLFASAGPATATAAQGNAYSTLIFGLYGLDRPSFLTFAQQAYMESGEAYAGSREAFEQAMALLWNPYEKELLAWNTVMKEQFQVTNLEEILRRYPEAKERVLEWLIAFTGAKEDLYQTVNPQGTAPTPSMRRTLYQGLKGLAKTHTDAILEEAAAAGLISRGKKTEIQEGIAYFCNHFSMD